MSGQLTALVGLRWRMVRAGRVRAGLALLAFSMPVSGLAAVVFGSRAPHEHLGGITLVTPSLYLAFAVVAVLAPLAAGGGYDLYPAEQLVAFPIRPSTTYLASLALTPLNLAWTTQVVALLGSTAYLVGNQPAGLARALSTLLVFVFATTVLGQAVAWTVVGVRHTRRGRALVWTVAGVASAAVLAVVLSGRTLQALDHTPTTWVLVAVLAGKAGGDLAIWALGTALLLLAGLLLQLAGARACAWALVRPRDGAVDRSARHHTARRDPRTARAAVLAVDRASVWRSASLRRGLVVLTVLPAAAAALARLDWVTLVMVPGLVAAGAGLLFGVNAFCLDAGGATWLASLPGEAEIAFRAKARVLAEITGGAVLFAAMVACARAAHTPSAAELTGVLGAAVASAAAVVAVCMRLSVVHPYRADLRGSRDTPAPPAAMAVHSLRLAVVTTFIALFEAAASVLSAWWAPLLAAVVVVAWASISLMESERLWLDPHRRALVVATLATV